MEDALFKQNRPRFFAEVILPVPVGETFTYAISEEDFHSEMNGKRVVVRFGKNRILTGIVDQIHQNLPEDFTPKDVMLVLDEAPLIKPKELIFWRWVAKYYACHLGEVMQMALPAGLKLESESVVVLKEDAPSISVLDPFEEILLTYLREKKELAVSKAGEITQTKSAHKYLKSLYEKGQVTFIEDLSAVYKAKTKAFISLNPDLDNDNDLNDLFNQLEKRAPKQVDVLMQYLKEREFKGVELEKSKFLKKNGLSAAAVKALVDKQILQEEHKEVSRLQQLKATTEIDALKLNDLQQKAFEACVETDKPSLLYGITGSGKTAVYLKLIEQQIAQGNQVLFLLPEIAITTQLLQRLQVFLGDKVRVVHSRFNVHERYEIWQAVREGECALVLGPRSAIFMPFKSLGLIIVDEEHESSYKQFDPAPRFHGRDAALYLGKLHNAKIVLGSATPAIESYWLAQNGSYHLVEMKERYGGISLPEIEIVDLKEEQRTKNLNGLFSTPLIREIKESLNGGAQVILFQNRKGYVPTIECKICGWAPRCANCDITLTYYRNENILRCHYCGYQRGPITSCSRCKSTHLIMTGFGTEKLEDETQLLFPNAKIARMDYNTTRGKKSHEQLIYKFENQGIDILIGTQMVSKGLDFEKVHLVGIMDADQMLNFPDFRSHERSFQMIEQVAGRAGRRASVGKVIVQTRQPNHALFGSIVGHDYQNWVQKEIGEREKFNYPPFIRLIRIDVKHKDFQVAEKAAEVFANILKRELGDSVVGPSVPYVGRIRTWFIQQLLLKFERNTVSVYKIKDWLLKKATQLKENPSFNKCRVTIDVDPV